MIEVAGSCCGWLPRQVQPPLTSVIKAAAGRMGISAWDTMHLSTAKRGNIMTEQTGQNGPPEWYTKPPEWLSAMRQPTTPPASGGGYSAGRQDAELLTAVRAMPETVVNALREAIQGANSTAQQASAQNPPAAQQQQAPPAQPPADQQQQQQETKPTGQKSFADRWFDNSL
jgi:hypothetical protein